MKAIHSVQGSKKLSFERRIVDTEKILHISSQRLTSMKHRVLNLKHSLKVFSDITYMSEPTDQKKTVESNTKTSQF